MNERTMLLFTPHPDDEVLGAGGTIARKARLGWHIVDCVVTIDNNYKTRRKEALDANRELGITETIFMDFPDLCLDKIEHGIFTQAICEILQKYKPYEIYVPHPGDLHTDHKALTAAVMVAIRPKYNFSPAFAYTYETLSETGIDYQSPQNCFSPNIYIDITNTIDAKVNALLKHESQIEDFPGSRCEKAVKALATYRGAQAGMIAAEAFSIIRGYDR